MCSLTYLEVVYKIAQKNQEKTNIFKKHTLFSDSIHFEIYRTYKRDNFSPTFSILKKNLQDHSIIGKELIINDCFEDEL
jgi:hypothetical protein